MLELKEIKRLHDTAYESHQVTRERASDDLVFYWVTHWDDNSLQESQLAYRGEFDILRKAGRSIMADLASNPIQNDFEPKGGDREDAAELLDGMYRADCNRNDSLEAFSNSDQETVVCGFGAWEIYTEYETTRAGNNNQIIRRRPVYEANNTAYCDPNAKLLDKSDSNFWSILTAYSNDGYLDLVEELTDERPDSVDQDSFKHPEQSYSFPWIGGEGKKIYVTSFYHREKVTVKILTMENPFGQVLTLKESDLEDIMDEMLEDGFEVIDEKEVDQWEVRKYIASGSEILNGEEVDGERTGEVIAGQNLPIVPCYGEHAFIEGEEHYEGVTRLAKDPQRLRDFQMSYLADIVSRSPRPKPIFQQEQVAGFEHMYEENGADNNFPYLLQNRFDEHGQPLAIGPIAMMPEQTIPQALVASIGLSREAVNDVADAGLPQDIADPDVSGKAVLALQARLDMQSMVYQEHRKHSLRRDAEVYASMASEVYDVPRKVKVEMPDGTKKQVQVMETVMDKETGTFVTLNDLASTEFDVYSKIGSSFSSQKEQTLDRLGTLMQGINPADPKYNILLLKYMKLMDGVDFDDVRDYANKELLLLGVREPEGEEDEQILAEAAQQGQEPSAEMVLAQAEMVKGEAAKERNQIEAAKVQAGAQNEQMKRMIDEFKAATDRMNTQIDAQEAGANINYRRVDTFGKELDNQAKIAEMQKPENMSEDDLYQQILGG